MYTRNRVKTEVVLAEFAVPWELRPKRSSEGEKEREMRRVSRPAWWNTWGKEAYVSVRSPEFLSFEWCSSRILKRSPYFCTFPGRRLVKQAGPGMNNPIPTDYPGLYSCRSFIFRRRPPRTLFGSSGSYVPGVFSTGQLLAWRKGSLTEATEKRPPLLQNLFHASPQFHSKKK